MPQRRRWPVLLACVALAVTACSGGAATDPRAAAPASAAPVKPFAAQITPADSATGVTPDTKVVVRASTGEIITVSVRTAKGDEVSGALSTDQRTWTSTSPLRVAQSYQVTVVGANGDTPAQTITSSFTSVEPTKTMRARVAPLDGSVMGVGQPLVVYLTAPATDRAAVQRALRVETTPQVEGAWRWYSDTELHYRPQQFWAPGTTVTLRADLEGVNAGNGVWGDRSRVVSFRIGHAMVSTVDVKAHTLTVRRDGEVLKVIPVSTGKDGFLTRNGTKVILEKKQHKIMDSTSIGIPKDSPEYYRLDVYWAMRVTNSGEFLHAAPWSERSQGRDNVSHGCVGMSTKDAIWLFNRTRPGDVVKVVNSPRKLEENNGWTDWNLSWAQWTAGSALPVG